MRDRLTTGVRAVCGAALLAGVLAATGALAEDAKKGANPFQGFSSDNGKPVDIKSDTLEVHQTEQQAIFSGNVVAVQGDSTLKAPKLIVFYDNAQAGGGSAPSGNSSVKRLEASGGVVVTSQDQKATGDNGVFDMASNTATMTGNVVMTQGQNVIRGKQLVVDMTTGIAHVVGGTSGLFVPSSNNTAKPGAAKPPAKPKVE